MSLTPEQLDTLRHMLGINDSRRPQPIPHRDYYCANIGDENLAELARLGMVTMYSEHGGYEWYRTTRAGADAAIASFYATQATAAQRRYSKYLDCREVDADLTFKEFLTSAKWAQSRKDA